MRVGREGKVRDDGSEVEHRRELDAQLARRVDGDAELEGLADARRLHAGADAAPEGRVEKNHVNGRVEHVSRQLFEVDDHRVRRQRHPHLPAHAAHPGHAVDGVFQVVVAHALDLLSEPDSLLRRPDAVRVEAEAVAARRPRAQLLGQRAVTLQLVLGREDAALQLVRGEAVALLQRARVGDELLGRADFARARFRVRIAEEEVGGERDALSQPPAQDVGDGGSPLLAEQVEAGKFEGGEDLRAVVVERGRRVGDEEAHLFEAGRVVADQVSLHRPEHAFGGLAAAAHLAQADEPLVGLDLDDGADEAPPVAAVGVPERRLQRDGDGRGSDVGDLH